MSSQNAESKKEEFQRYLEKSGVIDALTKVLVGLYEVPEKPTNAIDFIKEYLGAAMSEDVNKLRQELDQKNNKILELEKELDLKKKEIEDMKKKSDT